MNRIKKYYIKVRLIHGYIKNKGWNANSYYPEKNRKNRREIIFDNIRFILKNGYIDNNYFAYGFDVRGVDMSEYYSGVEFCTLRNLASGRLGKKPNYTCLLENKELFELVAKSKKLNAVYTLGYYHDGLIINQLHSLFEDFLNKEPHLFLKTSTSEKGKGAFSVDYDRDSRILLKKI